MENNSVKDFMYLVLNNTRFVKDEKSIKLLLQNEESWLYILHPCSPSDFVSKVEEVSNDLNTTNIKVLYSLKDYLYYKYLNLDDTDKQYNADVLLFVQDTLSKINVAFMKIYGN